MAGYYVVSVFRCVEQVSSSHQYFCSCFSRYFYLFTHAKSYNSFVADFTVDIDVGTGDLLLVLQLLHLCGHAQVQSHVSPGMDC